MIDKQLPEPPLEVRACYCGKRKRLHGILVHWPNEDSGDEVLDWNGNKTKSFSTWLYECAWCKGIWTKQKKRWGLN